MFRRCISSQLHFLLVCPRPRPFVQAWAKFKSNDSHSSRKTLLNSFSFDPPMSCDILTSDLTSPCSPASIKQVHQKVCIVGQDRTFKISGYSEPGDVFPINWKGRKYHKKTGSDKMNSCMDKSGSRYRPRYGKRRSDRKTVQRLQELMNDGVDGVRKIEGKKEGTRMVMQIKKSKKSKDSRNRPASSNSEENEDNESEPPKNSIKDFLSMLLAKSKKVRQQLEEGKQADLKRCNPGKPPRVQRYKNNYYRKNMQTKPKPQHRKVDKKDQPAATLLQSIFPEDSAGSLKEEGILLGEVVSVQMENSNSKSGDVGKAIGGPEEPLKHSSKPHSLEVMRDREEQLISSAKKETDCRLQSLRISTTLEPPSSLSTPDKEKNIFKQEVSQDHPKNICEDSNVPLMPSTSSEQKQKISEEQSTHKSGSHEEIKTESKSEIKVFNKCSDYPPSDDQKPNIFKNQIHKHLWEHPENHSKKEVHILDLCKQKSVSCKKKEIEGSSDIKKTSPGSSSPNFDDQSNSKSLHNLVKNEIHKNLWNIPEKDSIKCENEPGQNNTDCSVCFGLLNDRDKLKFQIAEFIAKCTYLVEKVEPKSGSKNTCESEEGEKDKEVANLVDNFWRHYLQYRTNQNQTCEPDKSTIRKLGHSCLKSPEDCIMDHVETIIKQCKSIQKAIKGSGLEKKYSKANLKEKRVEGELKRKNTDTENELKRKGSNELVKKDCQPNEHCVEGILKKMCVEKYEKDYLKKMSLLIEQLQKKVEDDKPKRKCRKYDQKRKCSKEELKRNARNII
ncbi:uncharacterized protein LOC108041147 [Drosophila rhopaloa]|uniref:Uncharacterized protein n=1 Tax=Drosophila rhopaloa TaxID=1041015 RepID=A0ABM5H4Q5_DRORH|nr:uncharacterized protein LOC108041147 [Drosophila rhopaloa]